MARSPEDNTPQSDGENSSGPGDRPARAGLAAGRPPPLNLFTFRQLESCAAREAKLRQNVYAKHGITADREREIAMMQAIAEHFKMLADHGLELSLDPWIKTEDD